MLGHPKGVCTLKLLTDVHLHRQISVGRMLFDQVKQKGVIDRS